jgi:outer membrane lipoprotein SlyB
MNYLFCVLFGALFFSSCARQMSPDVYDAGAIGQVENTYSGMIVSVQKVGVQDGDRLQDNALGGIGGGVAGGMLGSTIGHGTGSLLGQIGGGIAGATIGALTEHELKREKALQYIVQLENGELKTIVQGTKPHLQEGEKVWVLVAHHGRSRIIARTEPKT